MDLIAQGPTQQNNTTQNDVWKTLGGFATALGDIYIKSETLKTQRAAAAPAGAAAVAPAPLNPFAGFWSSHPQNDTKGQFQNQAPFSFASINPLWIVLLGVFGLLLVFRSR